MNLLDFKAAFTSKELQQAPTTATAFLHAHRSCSRVIGTQTWMLQMACMKTRKTKPLSRLASGHREERILGGDIRGESHRTPRRSDSPDVQARRSTLSLLVAKQKLELIGLHDQSQKESSIFIALFRQLLKSYKPL